MVKKTALAGLLLLLFYTYPALSTRAIDPDLSKALCTSLGYKWVGLGGQENCCGDDEGESYVVNSSAVCYDASLVFCRDNCTSLTINGVEYYCFFGRWVQEDSFTGNFLKDTPDGISYGCCGAEECWNGQGCITTGVYGSFVCTAGTWVENTGNEAEGETQGSSSEEGAIPGNVTQQENPCIDAPCGAPCPGGVCNGLGACVPLADKGEACYCSGMCREGLICGKGGVCVEASAVCGNGVCEEGECSTGCKADCSLEDCIGNGACDVAIGENCMNSIDCRCPGKMLCKPESINANAWGCVAVFCGNGVCEEGECSTGCKADCSLEDCIGNGACDVAIGENCMNSPDCKCTFDAEVIGPKELVEGIPAKIELRIKNTGEAQAIVRPILSCAGCDLSYDNTSFYLMPGEEKVIEATVLPKASSIDLGINVAYSNRTLGVKAVTLQARKPTPLELFTQVVESPISFILDAWDLIAAGIAVIFAVLKILGLAKGEEKIYYPARTTYPHYFYYPYRAYYFSSRYRASSWPRRSFYPGSREGQR